MGEIYDWVKSIVFFYILMTAVLHLLPKSRYQKYVRFFAGLLLVILLINPILDFLYHPEYLLDKISYETFWQEMDTIKLDTEEMEATQQRIYIAEYEKAIGEDIVLMAQEEELLVNDVNVKLTREYTVEKVDLSVRLAGQEEGIYVEKIWLQDNSQEYPDVLELKKKLINFYKIEEEQIQITVQEG